jgi:hypothetical protein
MTSIRGRRSIRAVTAAVLAVSLCVLVPAAAPALPDRLSDADFWTLVTDISEPGGYFRITDNYTSNEGEVGQVVAELRARGVSGGVYLGVGPEQNFSYIAAVRPRMAFIIDIRRQAVMQHLMFKAAFELANDRADFIALLFAKPRPAGLQATMDIQRLWEAFLAVPTDRALAEATAARIVARLTETHKFTLTPEELAQLRSVLDAFVAYGPGISTRGSASGRGGALTFVDLTGYATDATGRPQSFLSTDEHFRTVKALHEKNLIVPVSGDFGGPKALRAIGRYVREAGGVVSAYYLSNVEQYLFQDAKDRAFYDNVRTLPVTPASVFIRPYAVRRGASALCPMAAFLDAAGAGRVFSNNDALACVRQDAAAGERPAVR